MDELAETPTERELTLQVRQAIEKQRQLDQATQQMAHEIIDGTKPEHIYQIAENWICTAAQHARNENYWWKRCQEAEMYLTWLVNIGDENENY
jgi:hypothetical protein